MLSILFGTITDAGLDAAVSGSDLFASACAELEAPPVRLLTRYATLGPYDFVAVAEARNAESKTRLSVELGSKAKVHIEPLHAVSAHLLAEPSAESVIRVGETKGWDIPSSPVG